MVQGYLQEDDRIEGRVIVRKETKKICIGNVYIGGDSPVSVQSMTNTDTRDVRSTVEQIKRLQDAGCDIVRIAVPNMEAADAFKKIKNEVNIPIVADIHFDYRLAIESINNGADKIRINPGNIGSIERITEVVNASRARGIPIRVGVNSGSLEKELVEKYGGVTVDGLVESAVKNAGIIEGCGYDNIVISIKASNVLNTIMAYRKISELTNYPLHIGVTEAGTIFCGTIKTAVGLGTLLAEGIGDTMRVSLTGDPVEEVRVGMEILKSLGLRERGVIFISCPTCGRCKVNLIEIANRIESKLSKIEKPLKVAVMGCAVNGPGEAVDADIGVACGDGCGLIFKKGEIIRKVPEGKIEEELMNEINSLI